MVIVARRHPELYDYLRERFVADPGVEVILDRRSAERRQRGLPVVNERRRGDRRLRPDVDELLGARSHVIVTVP
jgi:hypothetical protein